MKPWMILAASVPMAACGGPPRIILTSANSHSIQFSVQNAKFVPLQNVEDRALRHCADYGLVPRQTQAAWVDDSSMTFHFECDAPRKPVSEKLADAKATEVPILPPPVVPPPVVPPPIVPPKAPAANSATDGKQAAWKEANAMSPIWAKCILDEATRMARTSSDRADVAAIAVAASCSQWERDIHEVLQRAGEDDGEFQAALHRQAIEFATARITSARAGPVQVPVPSSQRPRRAVDLSIGPRPDI
jgi:hypothetical protein